MAPPLLILRDIRLSFAGTALFEGAEMAVHQRARLCIVGRNGSGKSTLMKIAAGMVEPDAGERFVQPGVTVRYLAQEPDFTGFSSVRDYVEAGLAPGDAHHRAGYLLSELGLTGDEDPAALSGGEARRAALACAMAPQPDILLLDEPTNHLDLPAIEWLEAELGRLDAALVLISHDRRFLERLSEAVLWVERGQVRRLDRGFAHFETWRDELLDREETERHKLDRKIVAEEHWLRYGVTARRKRNQGRLRRLKALRTERREQRRATGTIDPTVSSAGMSGKRVIEADGVSKAFGSLRVVDDLSLRVLRGDRIGIVGPNGAGKTTLVNLLTGALAPDAGTVSLGTNIEMVTLDQRRESLDPELTLRDALTGGGGDTVFVGGAPRHVISYMKDFLFAPEQARLALSVLSGGERGRLMLARAFARPSNLLVLDEPTNDLDLETLDLLQELIADYSGTALIVSHDRDFLDRVVTSTLAAQGDGRWREYAGGYSDMEAQRAGEPETPARKDKLGRKQRQEPTASASESVAANAGSGRARTKLSYKEKFALESLPARIAGLEASIDELEARLAAPDFYTRDPAAFAKAVAELEAAREGLSHAEDEWLALELKREAVEKA